MATSYGSMRVLEFFSGIGGMHYALRESQVPHEVVTAIDISTTANKIYLTNFPETPLKQCSIQHLTATELEKLRIDAVLMSPPCQPFTRIGKKRDDGDIRTVPFLHILSLISQLKHKPKYILVENVKGFDVSRTREQLVETLGANDYQYQEFLLTPLQFGIPNARLRYYLLAKRNPLHFHFATSEQPMVSLTAFARAWLVHLSQTSRHPESREPSLQDSSASPPTPQTSGGSDPSVCSSLQDSGLCDVTEHHHVQDDSHEECRRNNERNSAVVRSNSGADFPSDSHCQKESRPRTSDSDLASSDTLSKDVPGCGRGASAVTDCGCRSEGTVPDNGLSQEKSSEEDDAMEREGFILRQVEVGSESNYGQRRQLRSFLENLSESQCRQYFLSDRDLQRFVIMDVAHPAFRKTICFTKRYGHFVEGAGSLLQMSSDVEAVRAACELKERVVNLGRPHDWPEEDLEIVRRLRLRYFTPREIANLLCFPPDFDWPSDTSTIQLYRTLGNSLNVHVVAVLIRLMTYGDVE